MSDDKKYVVCGKAINAIIRVFSKHEQDFSLTRNYNTEDFIYTTDIDGVKIAFVTQSEHIVDDMNVTTAKFFYATLANFNQKMPSQNISMYEINHYRACGYAVNTDPDAVTPSKNDLARINHAVWCARRITQKNLDILKSIQLQFVEDLRDNKADKKPTRHVYSEMKIIDDAKISNGIIHIRLSAKFVEYIRRLPLRPYQDALLSANTRRPYEIEIGYKLVTHFYNRTAITQNHRNRLTVKNIVNSCSLPTLEEVKLKGKSWKSSKKGGLKVAFEDAMDELVSRGVISEWHYMVDSAIIRNRYFYDFFSWYTAIIVFSV